MTDSAPKKNDYDPELYWRKRYEEVDITKSGHIDLPAVYNHWLYRRKKECLMDVLGRVGFQPEGSKVFEIATGTGVYVEMWKQKGGVNLVGVDISQSATDFAKQRFPGYCFYKRDISEPGLENTVGVGFDLVTAIDVLYHVVDDSGFETALTNIATVIKPGGVLVLHEQFRQHGERHFGYIRCRTLKDYTAALQKAGFEVLLRSPTFFLSVRPFDFASRQQEELAGRVWDRIFYRGIIRFPHLAGWLGYWSDRVLGSFLQKGLSFEMMVCRKL